MNTKKLLSVIIVLCFAIPLMILIHNTHKPTNIELIPCSAQEVIAFFSLLEQNPISLNQRISFGKNENGDTKITWSYTKFFPEEDDWWDYKHTFYLPNNNAEYDFYDNEKYKEYSFMTNYNLYKGNLHNDGKISYILIFKHSGREDNSGIINAWTTTTDNTLLPIDYDLTPEQCDGLAEPFVVIINNAAYLRFFTWKLDNPEDIDKGLDYPPIHQVISLYKWHDNIMEKISLNS